MDDELTTKEKKAILVGVDFFIRLDYGKIEIDNDELAQFVAAAHEKTDPSSVEEKAYAKFRLFSDEEIRQLYLDEADKIILDRNRYRDERAYLKNMNEKDLLDNVGTGALSEGDIRYQLKTYYEYLELEDQSEDQENIETYPEEQGN